MHGLERVFSRRDLPKEAPGHRGHLGAGDGRVDARCMVLELCAATLLVVNILGICEHCLKYNGPDGNLCVWQERVQML